MGHYEISGLRGIRRGRPFAITKGYPNSYIELGENSLADGSRDMGLARVQALPLVAHNALEQLRENDYPSDFSERDSLDFYAALLLTNSLAPEKIRHYHNQVLFENAGISEDDLECMNGMLRTCVQSGLSWTSERIKKRSRKFIEPKYLILNLELMSEILEVVVEGPIKLSDFRLAENGILTKVK